MADTLTARRAPSTFALDAIGTRWCIDTDEPLGGDLRDRVLDRIRRFDRTYSRFRPDSLVAQVAGAPAGGRFTFPEDSVALFDLYDHLVTATDGAVDPLVGRQLELLGYDPAYSLTPAPDAVRAHERARARATWAADVVRDGTTLVTRRPLVIDVGVVAAEAALADGLATALFFTGAHRLAETHRFTYVRMLADGRAERSPGFDGEAFHMKGVTVPRRATLRTTIIAISIAAATAGCATTDAGVTTPSSAPDTSVAAPGAPSSRRSRYADGTYNATGQYGGLPSSIGVTVTLVDGEATTS